jgi:hypothetical protein
MSTQTPDPTSSTRSADPAPDASQQPEQTEQAVDTQPLEVDDDDDDDDNA